MEKALERVLVAEDDEDIRLIVHHLLETIGGYCVESCQNGAQALEAIPRFEPDLFLSDVMMPEMNGVCALEIMKRTPGLCKIPVVFMTARAQENEVEEYREKGVTDVIAKPFDLMGVVRMLTDIWAVYEAPEKCP